MLFASDDMRSRHDLPVDWQAYSFKVLGSARAYVELTGGVYPVKITRGPSAGEPNYRKATPGTERIVIVTRAEYAAMLDDPRNNPPDAPAQETDPTP